MFHVDISTAVVLYLAIALFGLLWSWVRFEKGRAFRKYEIGRKQVWTCSVCAHTYVDSKEDTLSRCPQCQSLNEKK